MWHHKRIQIPKKRSTSKKKGCRTGGDVRVKLNETNPKMGCVGSLRFKYLELEGGKERGERSGLVEWEKKTQVQKKKGRTIAEKPLLLHLKGENFVPQGGRSRQRGRGK